ncbi:Pkinase-domain-containing protein, partial [Fomitiporia mediterranea MF3/22]|uniref:Pkinase-domain-containing protein n=1 Tax=Fomitiporia mediterranea (strain MF3/22) TaxID=694068 RepID=UPI0004408314
IDNGRFHLIERLGQGGYSVVYLATDSHSCRPGSSNPSRVAIKCLLNTRKCKIVREVALHKRAASIPGVVKIFRTFEEGGLFFVVLEYCPNGDLFGVLTEEQLFLGRDRLIKSVFLQLLDTVAAMHKLGVYHRDLKPENILCASSPSMCNGQPTSLTVLIADFGLATESELSESFGCGSYVYMTPECLAGMYSRALPHYSSRAADIWALGVILVNLVCGRSPWKTALLSDPSFRRYIRDVRWLRQMLPLSMPAYHFLNKIFSNHGNRVAISDLRRQFAEIDTF